MACTECTDTTCPGVNKLRHFDTWDELAGHCSEELILAAVNNYVAMRDAQKEQGARYRAKQQALARVAKRLLDPDELEAIERQAAQKVEER